MRPYPLAFVLLPLALLAAGPSPAATPLPFPPFTGGGFVPPTKDAAHSWTARRCCRRGPLAD